MLKVGDAETVIPQCESPSWHNALVVLFAQIQTYQTVPIRALMMRSVSHVAELTILQTQEKSVAQLSRYRGYILHLESVSCTKLSTTRRKLKIEPILKVANSFWDMNIPEVANVFSQKPKILTCAFLNDPVIFEPSLYTVGMDLFDFEYHMVEFWVARMEDPATCACSYLAIFWVGRIHACWMITCKFTIDWSLLY